MRHYLFLDESGDHGLRRIDQNFPVFCLCGILISEKAYLDLKEKLNNIKKEFWDHQHIILHSRDIRKCEKDFKIFFDLDIKKKFYEKLEKVVKETDYKIISATIQKKEIMDLYGPQFDNVYGMALSFIVERTVFCLDEKNEDSCNLQMVLEKRGAKEDKNLEKYFQRIRSNGTSFVSAERICRYQFGFHFRNKKDNVNGLQFADLIAYPIARYVLTPESPNLSFQLFKEKIYGDGQKFGLKIFP